MTKTAASAPAAVVLSIVGQLNSPLYYEAKLLAEDLLLHIQQQEPPVLAFQLHCRHQTPSDDSITSSLAPRIHHSIFGRIRGIPELLRWAETEYAFHDVRAKWNAQQIHEALLMSVQQSISHYVLQNSLPSPVKHQYVTLEFELDARFKLPITRYRLLFELDTHKCPRTVANFLSLCEGDQGLHYLKAPIHRVVPSSYFQSGDIDHGRGDGGRSSFSHALFADECLTGSHASAGSLSMVNNGSPHTNQSQFLVTLAPMPRFKGKFVQFGRLIYDHSQLLPLLNNAVEDSSHYAQPIVASSVSTSTSSVSLPASPSSPASDATPRILLRRQRPLYPIEISDCGEFYADVAQREFDRWNKMHSKQQAALAKTLVRPATASIHYPPATILVIGPMASGKTSLVAAWCNNHEGMEGLTPTLGFELDRITGRQNFAVSLYGLGGSPSIKDYWSAYYDAAHGFVYVVDGSKSDAQYWQQTQRDLLAVQQHELMLNKPFTIVVNQRRASGVNASLEQIAQWLQQPLSSLIACNAQQIAPSTDAALDKLLDLLRSDYANIHERVTRDVEARQAAARLTMLKRKQEQARLLELEKEREECKQQD